MTNNQIANTLSLRTSLSEAGKKLLAQVRADSEKWDGISALGVSILVRHTIWGRNRQVAFMTRGLSDRDKFELAVRLADLTKFVFWSYRKRTKVPPTDDDFMLGLESVKNDFEHEEELKEFLCSLKLEWQADGSLPSDEILAEFKSGKLKLRQASVKSDVKNLELKVDALNAKIELLASSMNEALKMIFMTRDPEGEPEMSEAIDAATDIG